MTSRHVESLKQKVECFLGSNKNVQFEELNNYICKNGFRMADKEMFFEWLQDNFPGKVIVENSGR